MIATNIFIVFLISTLLFMILSVVFISIWVYRDAKQRGLQAGLWTVLVLLGGNFIGLIIYLLIGRKQQMVICEGCGGKTAIGSSFCPVCGGKLADDRAKESFKSNKHLITICIICIVLSFVSFGAFLLTNFSTGSAGFRSNNQYSYYSWNAKGFARKVSQKSSGSTWRLSFEEVSEGYTFSKIYTAVSKPLMLSVDVESCMGTLDLLISQGNNSIRETLGPDSGVSEFDLSGFQSGDISIQLLNINAGVFSGTIIVSEMV